MSAQGVVQGTAEAGRTLDWMRGILSDAVVERHYQLRPELEARHGERGREKYREDTSSHLMYLAHSLAAGEPALFREYIAWVKVLLAGHGTAARDLAENLHVTGEVLWDRLPASEAAAACRHLGVALAALPKMTGALASGIAPEQPLTDLARAYLAALLACRRQEASGLVLNAVQSGTSIKEIYLQVFQRSQEEIGRLWQVNRISVAQEHYCTAATQMIMSQLYPYIFGAPKIGRSFMGTSVSGNLHEIGIRIVSDFFELDGWDTVFLGSSIPDEDLIRMLQQRRPDVLGISATMVPQVESVTRTIAAIRATPECDGLKIMVGGYPFLAAPELWKTIGADGSSQDAQSGVELANRLVGTAAVA